MICWSCEREAASALPAGRPERGAVCAGCGAILPPDPALDAFAVLGLPYQYSVDLKAAEESFRALSRQFHPDRFTRADPRARRASLQRSVQLNEAWRTIKDPIRRAEYLLERAGYQIGAEEGASRAAAGSESERERIPVPPELLAEVLELREELADARVAGDESAVQRLASQMRERLQLALQRVEVALTAVSGTASAGRDLDFETAARELIAIRYFRRFLEEVAVHDESVAASNEGAVHG